MIMLARYLSRLYRRDDRPGLVEIALLLALVTLAAIGVVGFVGVQLSRLVFSIGAVL